jgi:hypothetical protein
MNNGASVACFLLMQSDAAASIKMYLHRYKFYLYRQGTTDAGFGCCKSSDA